MTPGWAFLGGCVLGFVVGVVTAWVLDEWIECTHKNKPLAPSGYQPQKGTAQPVPPAGSGTGVETPGKGVHRAK